MNPNLKQPIPQTADHHDDQEDEQSQSLESVMESIFRENCLLEILQILGDNKQILRIMERYELMPDEKQAKALGRFMAAYRSRIKKAEPAIRRQYCADVEASTSYLHSNKTGRFFNGFAGAGPGPSETDLYRELGKKIMAERNPNYEPKT